MVLFGILIGRLETPLWQVLAAIRPATLPLYGCDIVVSLVVSFPGGFLLQFVFHVVG